MTDSVLSRAAENVCTELRAHAAVCEQSPNDPVAVVRQGERLRKAMLHYEVALGEVSGWSLPLRYLGHLEDFAEDNGADASVDIDPRGSQDRNPGC
ncbi:hypothetical protein OG203_05650 [Nocardia sp. NBC_01499]|uniref:hypothetical protein n=1 Tax=Nocardia sp. NBC_01499 TaxID=2903597 RepID=UPI00386DAB16